MVGCGSHRYDSSSNECVCLLSTRTRKTLSWQIAPPPRRHVLNMVHLQRGSFAGFLFQTHFHEKSFTRPTGLLGDLSGTGGGGIKTNPVSQSPIKLSSRTSTHRNPQLPRKRLANTICCPHEPNSIREGPSAYGRVWWRRTPFIKLSLKR